MAFEWRKQLNGRVWRKARGLECSEDAESLSGQMHEVKKYLFNGVTNYSRVWRKGVRKRGSECVYIYMRMLGVCLECVRVSAGSVLGVCMCVCLECAWSVYVCLLGVCL